jgi:hypothetical protein
MPGRNLERWEMPGSLEEYIEHFYEADRLFRRLQTMLNDLATRVAHARSDPTTLVSPRLDVWPTQVEIVELGKAAQDKKVPLMAEYSRLPADFQKHAPHPNDLGRG